MEEDACFIAADKDRLSDEFNYKIDMKVNDLIKESYERVKELLLKNEDSVNLIVENLLKKETLSAEDVKEILENIQQQQKC